MGNGFAHHLEATAARMAKKTRKPSAAKHAPWRLPLLALALPLVLASAAWCWHLAVGDGGGAVAAVDADGEAAAAELEYFSFESEGPIEIAAEHWNGTRATAWRGREAVGRVQKSAKASNHTATLRLVQELLLPNETAALIALARSFVADPRRLDSIDSRPAYEPFLPRVTVTRRCEASISLFFTSSLGVVGVEDSDAAGFEGYGGVAEARAEDSDAAGFEGYAGVAEARVLGA